MCYVVANAIILFGHCLWYAPSVLWLGFIRWEVRWQPPWPRLAPQASQCVACCLSIGALTLRVAVLQCLAVIFVLFWIEAHNSAPYKISKGGHPACLLMAVRMSIAPGVLSMLLFAPVEAIC